MQRLIGIILNGGESPWSLESQLLLYLGHLRENIYAGTQNSYNDMRHEEWSTFEVSVSIPHQAGATASTSDNEIKSYGEVYISGYASGEAKRYGEFQVSGSGLIVFAIPYTISGEIRDDNLLLEDAFLESLVYLEVSKGNSNGADYDYYSRSEVYFYKDYSWADTGEWNDSGWLSVVLYFNDGETGTFEAGTYTYADQNAPIPSSIIILTSGIGIIFIRRRYVYE